MSKKEDSNFNHIDDQFKTLTFVMWCVAGASVVSMFLAIVGAVLIISSR